MFDTIAFYLFSALAIGTSFLVIGQRNLMYSVLLLVASFLQLSGLYVLLDAPFTAVTQMIVYAGAIMVLFLFVVMLLNAPQEDAAEWDRTHPFKQKGLGRFGGFLALLVIAEIGLMLFRVRAVQEAVGAQAGSVIVSSVREIGRVIFTDYVFAFEATSILILVAMVGAYVLARQEGKIVIPLSHYLIVSAILFGIGTAGVFMRRNVITILLSIEIMLNAVNLTFVAFGRFQGTVDGQVISFFVMTVAAAEAAVGLAIVISLFRHRESLNPDGFTTLRW